MATPRKSEHALTPGAGLWTLRSAGGTRPALVIWGAPPSDGVLDRLARAGLAVLTPPPAPPTVTPDDLLVVASGLPGGALDGIRLAPVGVVWEEAPDAQLTQRLTESQIPWYHANSDWDAVPRWFAGGLK